MPITISCDFCNESFKSNDLELNSPLYIAIQSNGFGVIYINGNSFIACTTCMEKVNNVIKEEEENRTSSLRKRLEELRSEYSSIVYSEPINDQLKA